MFSRPSIIEFTVDDHSRDWFASKASSRHLLISFVLRISISELPCHRQSLTLIGGSLHGFAAV